MSRGSRRVPLWGRIRRQVPAGNDRTPTVAAGQARRAAAARSIAPLSTDRHVETAARSASRASSAGRARFASRSVASVHRAPGNPRMPADRRGRLIPSAVKRESSSSKSRLRRPGPCLRRACPTQAHPVRLQASNWTSKLRDRRRSRRFPCATPHGGAGRQRHGHPLGPRQDEQPRGDRFPHRRRPRLFARCRGAAELDDRLGRIPADRWAGRLDAGPTQRQASVIDSAGPAADFRAAAAVDRLCPTTLRPPEYSGPAGRNLGIDDLVPLRFGGLSESKRWVNLHASGSNELHFTSGDHLRRRPEGPDGRGTRSLRGTAGRLAVSR